MRHQCSCVVVLILALGCLSASAAQSGLLVNAKSSSSVAANDAVFHSVSLGRDMRYRIIFPRNYGSGATRFPVLYLLHGLYGDYRNWDTRTSLERYAEDLPLLIVTPDAGDSWYTNSATIPKDRFENYIAEDLVAEIDARYRTIRSRNARAIAGLSMGGYGAIKLALKYPRLFAFAGSLSGAFDAARDLETRMPHYREKLLPVFGDPASETRGANDIFLLIKEADASSLAYFYIACGTADGFLPVNREFVSNLPALNVAYEYHESPGGHTWEFWDRSVRDMLRSLSGRLQLATSPSK